MCGRVCTITKHDLHWPIVQWFKHFTTNNHTIVTFWDDPSTSQINYNIGTVTKALYGDGLYTIPYIHTMSRREWHQHYSLFTEREHCYIIEYQVNFNKFRLVSTSAMRLNLSSLYKKKDTKLLVSPLPTDSTKCPYSTNFICQFQINFFLHFAPKKRKYCPIFYIYILLKNLFYLSTYLPTQYTLRGPVGKGETNTFLS
jgi:hypothetical protein